MKKILFRSVPFAKAEVTLALEAGADGLIVPAENLEAARALARCAVLDAAEIPVIRLAGREDEEKAANLLDKGNMVMLCRGWEIIPVENLLAHEDVAGRQGQLALEVDTAQEAILAAGILEKGVDMIVVSGAGVAAIKDIAAEIRRENGRLALSEAVITGITPVGIGHRVCVDTLSLFKTGQGMLTGNSAAFTFLVNAETEHNEYVAARPFRINAGAVHAYACMPGDKTCYLEELDTGAQVLIVDEEGKTSTAIVGRVKVEKRPMLLLEAESGGKRGTVFLQNAETIRLVQPGGTAASVVTLAPGDKIVCRVDTAGRHFGLRIKEEILE
ncbi:MAG: 3-dehydroquinate synthase II family protein [Deltaproteobacteria bacterium]|jgi:3-dehydroquinate synthase II|nr:3-dehydroquinate synthase II family protein [Deltaproteobacteria bacterium]